MNEFFREPKKNPFLIANRLLKKGADPGPKVPAGILFIFFYNYQDSDSNSDSDKKKMKVYSQMKSKDDQ